MRKAEARQLFRAKRRALTEADWMARSEAICHRFFTWFTHQQVPAQPVIHTFLPIRKQQEVDTWRIIRRLWQGFPHVIMVAPVANLQTGTMTHRLLTPDTPVLLNTSGIPEPAADSPEVATEAIDLVLVPLLAFDQRGQRVGYGGGFYDRFLNQCRPDCRKAGLSLFEPVEVIDDVFEGDVQLDFCLSPDRFYPFSPTG